MKNRLSKRIAVLVNSPSWCSTISERFPKPELSWVLDWDGLEKELGTNKFCAAIIEFPKTRIDQWLVSASKLSNNPFGVMLFAVGNEKMLAWKAGMQAAGLCGWVWSQLQTESLVNQILRHQSNSKPGGLTLESSIEAALPWADASNQNLT